MLPPDATRLRVRHFCYAGMIRYAFSLADVDHQTLAAYAIRFATLLYAKAARRRRDSLRHGDF